MSEPTQHDQQTGAPVPTDDSTTSTAGAGGETIGATPDATTGSDGSLAASASADAAAGRRPA